MPSLRLAAALCLVLPTVARADPPAVATDIAPVHGLVARVMQGVGTPAMVLPVGASPHGHALRPSEAAALSDADIVVWIGADLTPGLGRAIDTLASEAEVLTLLDADVTRRLTMRSGDAFEGGHDHANDDHGEGDHAHEEHAHDEHGHDDHAHDDHADDEHAEDKHAEDEHAEDEHGHDDHGHAHGGVDAHAWLDPANARAWLPLIAETLARRDPANADLYRANAAAGQDEIAAAEALTRDRLAGLSDVPFVVFHDAYQYYESAFGLRALGAVSLSDAQTPSAGHLADLRARAEAGAIRCAFAEPQFDPGLLSAVAEGLDANVGIIDPLGAGIATGPGFYPALLLEIAGAFDACR